MSLLKVKITPESNKCLSNIKVSVRGNEFINQKVLNALLLHIKLALNTLPWLKCFCCVSVFS